MPILLTLGGSVMLVSPLLLNEFIPILVKQTGSSMYVIRYQQTDKPSSIEKIQLVDDGQVHEVDNANDNANNSKQ